MKNIIRIPFDYAVEREASIEGDRMTRQLLIGTVGGSLSIFGGLAVLNTTPLMEDMSWKRKIAFTSSIVSTAAFSIIGEHKHNQRLERESQ